MPLFHHAEFRIIEVVLRLALNNNILKFNTKTVCKIERMEL
jgi:hypothetical protein